MEYSIPTFPEEIPEVVQFIVIEPGSEMEAPSAGEVIVMVCWALTTCVASKKIRSIRHFFMMHGFCAP
jgi:hypothetical protein